MSAVYWSQTPQNISRSYDVVIIGGGYVGLSTAYWLKKNRPQLSVAIIEKDSIGAGASGRNAGFLTKGSLLFYHHLYKEWGESTTVELFEYAQSSILLVEKELKLVENKIAQQTSSFTFLRSSKVQKDIASLPQSILKNFKEDSTQFLKGKSLSVHSSENEFSINPMMLLTRLYHLNFDSGVEFIIGAQVESIQNGNRVELETSYGEIHCDSLAVCSNGYSHLLPELKLEIIPQRAQMLALKLEGDIYKDGLFYDPEERVYFKFNEPGVVLIGGKRLVDPVSEQTIATDTSKKIQDALYNYAREELQLTGQKIASWAGTMGFTKSEIPFVGQSEVLKSCYVAAGFSGHGMGWGFKTAQELANNILDNTKQPQLAKIKK